MASDRQVKVSLIIDDHGSVSVMRQAGTESEKTEGKMKHLDKGVKELGKSFGGLKNMIGMGLGALGIGGVAYGLKDAVSGMEEMASATEQFSATSGIGAQQSLLISAALKARGINAEAASKGFGFMTKNLQNAERQWHTYGTAQQTAAEKGKVATGLLGVQATAFKELGLNIGQLQGMSGENKLKAVVESFEHMSPAMRKAGDQGRLMKQVFGKSGEGLATVLNGGALGLTAMTKAAKEFFPTLNVKQLEEMKVQTAYSNLAFEGLKFTLGQQLIPVLLLVDKWFVKVIREVEAGHGTWGEIGRDIEGVAKFAKELWKGFEGLVGPTNAVKLAVGGLLGVMVVSQVAGFVTALAAMGPALALLNLDLLPIVATIAAIYEGYKHIQEINEFIHPTVHEWKNNRGEYETYKGQKPKLGSTGTLREELAYSVAHINQPDQAGYAAKALDALAAQQKIDLHIDGRHFAEAVARNPAAARILAESGALYTSKQAARGAHK